MSVNSALAAFGWGLVGVLGAGALSFVVSYVIGVIGHLVSWGGIGAVGQEFTWSHVMEMTRAGWKYLAVIGFLVGFFGSIYGWVILPILVASFVIVYVFNVLHERRRSGR